MESFLNPSNKICVVGVSRRPDKWGYRVWKHLKGEGLTVFGTNPYTDEIDGEKIYRDLQSVPEKIDVVVTVVPPEVTDEIVNHCEEKEVKMLWMQPGSESAEAIKKAEAKGIRVIHDVCMVTDGMKQEFAEA